MEIDDVAAKIHPEHPYRDSIIFTLEGERDNQELVIEAKGEDLAQVVQRLKDQKLPPVVDKRFGLVFGVTRHLHLRTELYRYYYFGAGRDRPCINPNEAADRYISEGYGYFVSKMRPHYIVVGETYKPDRFDEALFAQYTLYPQDMNLARFCREGGRGML